MILIGSAVIEGSSSTRSIDVGIGGAIVYSFLFYYLGLNNQ